MDKLAKLSNDCKADKNFAARLFKPPQQRPQSQTKTKELELGVPKEKAKPKQVTISDYLRR